ncbi:hypothetical protein ACWDRR_00775 [Kitasatospora sp. NPDC003701]
MITNELILQAQADVRPEAGGRPAVELILAELERAALAIARKRAERTDGDQVEAAKDLAQDARLAFWEALMAWDVTADNSAEFTTYAIGCATGKVSDAAHSDGPVSSAIAKRYGRALKASEGDHEAARVYAMSPDRADQRLSEDAVMLAQQALAGVARIDAGGQDAEDAMAASVAPLQDAWAEEQGDLPEYMLYPLDLSRDAVRCKGVRTTGGGSGKRKRGAIVDPTTEAQNRAMNREVQGMAGVALLGKMSPTNRRIAELAFGFEGAPMLLPDGRMDGKAVASVLGKTEGTVKASWSREAKKLRGGVPVAKSAPRKAMPILGAVRKVEPIDHPTRYVEPTVPEGTRAESAANRRNRPEGTPLVAKTSEEREEYGVKIAHLVEQYGPVEEVEEEAAVPTEWENRAWEDFNHPEQFDRFTRTPADLALMLRQIREYFAYGSPVMERLAVRDARRRANV